MKAAQAVASTPRTQWRLERVVICLLAIAWLILCSPVPQSLRGTGMVVVLAIIALDLILVVGTRWVAFTPTSRLDERQAALRDDAYRTAFHWMRASLILMLILATVGTGIASVNGGSAAPGVPLRFLIAFLELLVILPTAVLAWTGDAFSASLDMSSTSGRRWWPLLLIPAMALGWIALSASLPARTIEHRGMNGMFDMTGATCDQFAVAKEVAAGFGGAVGFHAEVCWNGSEAFAFGDPSFTLPSGVLPEQEVLPNGPSLPWLTECSPGNAENDFARISQTCTEQVDADGTMTLTAHGRVSPLPGGLAGRDLQVQLTVSRDGKHVSVR